MNGENSADITVDEIENYTFVSPITLKMEFPDKRSSRDDIIREYPTGRLKLRTPEEKILLRDHPLFSV